jgi:predicted lipoprotein with Yx(FWY)xxD motif
MEEPMIRSALVIFSMSALAAIAAGCGGSGPKATASTSVASEAAMKHQTGEATKSGEPVAARATTVKVVSSQFGPILADSHGQGFYLFGKENSSQSRCYGECAKRWPPVIANGGRPHAGSGAREALVGTTRRRDGRLQLSYAGHPLYYYDADSPGHVLCQGVSEFGGLWLVVRPSGKPVR